MNGIVVPSVGYIRLIHSHSGTHLDLLNQAIHKKLVGISHSSTLLYTQARMSAEASSSTSNAHASVLMPSEELPADAVHIKGPDLSSPITLEELLKSYNTIGFQATGLSRAIQIVEEMVHPSPPHVNITDD